jgi:hypothetical protein
MSPPLLVQYCGVKDLFFILIQILIFLLHRVLIEFFLFPWAFLWTQATFAWLATEL